MSIKRATLPTLYKMSATGKIQQWEICPSQSITWEGDINRPCQYVIKHGQMDGKIQSKPTSILSGKNVGKANQTTAWEQCQLEAKSLWTKQRDRKGYSEQIPTEKPLRPMLAKTFTKDGHHIKFPAYVQPKLDGIRCLAMYRDGKVVLVSRTGYERKSLTHIEAALEPIFKVYPDIILDGELYNHDLKDDFQTIVSAIKRDKPNDKTHLIQYHIYDIVEEKMDFIDRKSVLFHALNALPAILDGCIRGVCTAQVSSAVDMDLDYSTFLQNGYEGMMIRNAKGGYKINGRSADLQKYKQFMDEEFIIVGAEQNKGTQINQCVFICQTEAGTKFKVKPRGDSEKREQYWTDWQAGKLHGKMLNVRFFEWTTSKNAVPRFPIGIYIRDFD